MATNTLSPKTKSNTPLARLQFCLFALGVIATGLLVTTILLLGNQKSHTDTKRLEAFQSLANAYVRELGSFNEATSSGRTANLTGIGLNSDDDLYFDYRLVTYKDRIPVSRQDNRVHFQCTSTAQVSDCSISTAVGDITEIPEDTRTALSEYYTALDRIIDLANAAEDEAAKDQYHAEAQQLYDQYKDLLTSF